VNRNKNTLQVKEMERNHEEYSSVPASEDEFRSHLLFVIRKRTEPKEAPVQTDEGRKSNDELPCLTEATRDLTEKMILSARIAALETMGDDDAALGLSD
jgi:hypothetical protein